MNSRIKTVTLVLTAVLAMSAIVASAASAKQFHSGSTSGTTYITGQQVGTYSFDLENGSTTKCTVMVLDASYAGTTASELTMTPTFGGCLTAGQITTVNMNGCQLTFTTPTIGADNDHYSATYHIVCNTGGIVQTNVPTAGCSYTIAAQTPGVPTVDLANVTTATANQDDSLLTWTGQGIKYTTHGGGICGASGSGKMTGQSTLKAYANPSHTEQRDLFIL